ncbi:phosphomannomutase/phosphoglucomutase [Frankia sp. AgB1.9]|uniref:phosphomannomutase/phosphoglucomutase n=1 Tax=unclassified Frankia TaxID=2632575 RepID=UPI001932CFE1|nr:MULTISPECIES: phosphomannomutase/phosphoglucomutase [unclassified Frankia]MBL7490894.1 phosphomannomutase/phosphoglucomutase [Frankia sp. AgW1.1]MBL7548334.1 phosphomannomutase/phosphoglucomutase [Frankia sp. AgB1.9]MBL7619042.1 phosphomannomutase/phosphoglucomutase [Frankia sp. AgB1.8]
MGLDLARIFKAYDVRGVVPSEFDADIARATGAAFVRLLDAKEIVIAHDMRESSGPLSAAFAEGATSQGADVVLAGLGSTDLLYFAAGSLNLPGAMFTASHNPAKYNGIKMCRAGAAPIGQETGLAEIRDMVATGVPEFTGTPGSVREIDLRDAYVAHLRGLVDLSGIRPLKVAVDAGNGMGGYTVPAAFADLPLDVVPLYFELDGSFPNHEANPIEPENLRDLQKAVRDSGADIGLAFDGDADRCFVVDERGELVTPSTITALVAERELAREPGGTIIHNVIVSKAVPELVRKLGAVPVRTRVGHSFIKGEMARTGAIFGGEHSGHFYFRDFWRADSGMLAALHVLAALGGQAGPLSALLDGYAPYAVSGEINSEVADAAASMKAIEAEYAHKATDIDHLDGLTISLADGSWFNLRPSNTEPLLRLNVEAGDDDTMSRLRDEVLASIRGGRD